jgi:hypothetical protein
MKQNKFEVKIIKDKYSTNLATTNNGYQWNSVTINSDDNFKKIMKRIKRYLYDKKVDKI